MVEAGPSEPTANASIATPEPSLDARTAVVKAMLADALASRHRDEYVELLSAQGLAASDSTVIVDTFLAGLADCTFETTQSAYESYGLSREEFVKGAEDLWKSIPPEYRSISVRGIAGSSPHCAAVVSQQAGIALPAVSENTASTASPPDDFGIWSAPNLLADPAGERAALAANERTDEMEAKLLAYVTGLGEAGIEVLRIKCEARGCMLLMLGNDIDVFRFDFDAFAEANGFQSALIGGEASHRVVTLRR